MRERIRDKEDEACGDVRQTLWDRGTYLGIPGELLKSDIEHIHRQRNSLVIKISVTDKSSRNFCP